MFTNRECIQIERTKIDEDESYVHLHLRFVKIMLQRFNLKKRNF